MPNPVTTNVLLQVPLHGAEVDTWDVPNNSDWTSVDGFLAGVQGINVAGSSPVTLTAPTGTPTPAGGPTQAQNAALKFTGALTGGVTVTLPLPGPMIIHNLTTGSFRLFFRAVGSGQIIAVDQGSVQRIYNDGTNVYFVDLPPVGSYLDVCDSTVPGWILGCTVPPYLNCDGSSFSAVTYPYLAAKLGDTTLPDSRGRVRATLNQGTGRLTTANGVNGDVNYSAGGSDSETLTVAQLPGGITSAGSIAGSATSTGAFLQGGATDNFQSIAGSGQFDNLSKQLVVSSVTGTASVTVNNTGGLSHPNVQPTFIGGLTLIRAA